MIDDKVKLIGKSLIEDAYHSLSEWRYSHENSEQEYKVLYHYSTLDTCSKIILSNDVWLFDSSYCNDKQEYKNGLNYINSSLRSLSIFRKSDFPNQYDELFRYEYDHDALSTVRQEIIKRYDCLNRDWLCYVACFSKPIFNCSHYGFHSDDGLLDNDNLSMWRGYGNEANGGCLGIDYYSMVNQIQGNPNCLLVEVLYDAQDKDFFIKCLFRTTYELFCNSNESLTNHQRLNNLLELKIGSVSNDDLFLGLAYALHLVPSFFKHTGFKDERELRLVHSPDVMGRIDNRVSYLGDGKDARPYVPLSSLLENLKIPILSLTLGAQASDKDFHESIFRSGAYEHCKDKDIVIQHSLLPYRS
ncbi:DUF2971 domain-containing protein [Vibrio alginolyticus]